MNDKHYQQLFSSNLLSLAYILNPYIHNYNTFLCRSTNKRIFSIKRVLSQRLLIYNLAQKNDKIKN